MAPKSTSVCGLWDHHRQPEGECPLCHSTDITSDGETGGDSPAPGGTRPTVAADTETEATLAETLGDENDLLKRHEDRWERVDEGSRYRVRDPDGGVERARSRSGGRALLRRYYD